MIADYYPMENFFTTYKSVDVPKIELTLPLSDEPIDITSYVKKIKNNIPIIKDNLNNIEEEVILEEKVESSNNNDNVSFEQLLKEENVPAKITSGYRGKGNLRGGKTAQGKRSNHNRVDEHGNPMAYDIVPESGYTFDDLRKVFYNNPRIVNWIQQRGWGVLEEMQDGKRGFYDVLGNFHYTGATGPHFHVGPDTHAKHNYNHKISKAQLGIKFPFTVYKPVEIPKVELNIPLQDEPIDISLYAKYINESGIPIINNNLNNNLNDNILENQENTHLQQEPTINIPESKGKKLFEKLLEEVSNESGFEELKNSEIKNILLSQAKRESNFDYTAKNKTSSASGYFLFIDRTRKLMSNKSKEEFIKDPKELIRTAYKYYKWIHSLPQAQKLKNSGYNNTFITTLGWWYPRSMLMVLDGVKNFSLGGYSIKKAFLDYEQNKAKDYFS